MINRLNPWWKTVDFRKTLVKLIAKRLSSLTWMKGILTVLLQHLLSDKSKKLDMRSLNTKNTTQWSLLHCKRVSKHVMSFLKLKPIQIILIKTFIFIFSLCYVTDSTQPMRLVICLKVKTRMNIPNLTNFMKNSDREWVNLSGFTTSCHKESSRSCPIMQGLHPVQRM